MCKAEWWRGGTFRATQIGAFERLIYRLAKLLLWRKKERAFLLRWHAGYRSCLVSLQMRDHWGLRYIGFAFANSVVEEE